MGLGALASNRVAASQCKISRRVPRGWLWSFGRWWLGTGLRFRRWKVPELARTVPDIEASGCLYNKTDYAWTRWEFVDTSPECHGTVGRWVLVRHRDQRHFGEHYCDSTT